MAAAAAPGLAAGLLGANVGGIPGNDNPWAFVLVVGIVLVLFPLELMFLRWLKWLQPPAHAIRPVRHGRA